MTPRTDMVAVNIDNDLATILETISKAGHSRIPVYENNIDNITGLVYAKDLLGEIGKDPKGFKLRDKMRQAYFVPETKPLRALREGTRRVARGNLDYRTDMTRKDEIGELRRA